MPATRELRFLFVCTANVCRSPLAAAWMAKHSSAVGLAVKCCSASLDQTRRAAHPLVSRLIAEGGGAGPPAHSQPVDAEIVEWADLVLTMTGRHAIAVASAHRFARTKVFTIDHFAQIASPVVELDRWLDGTKIMARHYPSHPGAVDITDPIGRDESVFRSVNEQLDALTKLIAVRLTGDTGLAPAWLEPI